jgi:hypothetical protein
MISVVGLTGLLHLALVMDKMERYHPKERHYYLKFIGVGPKHQGSDTGTASMKPILDICDREKCVAYLENSKEVNFNFYDVSALLSSKRFSWAKAHLHSG